MKATAFFGAILLWPLVLTVSASDQEPAASTSLSVPRCDPAIEKPLEQAILLNEPGWKVSAHYRSSANTLVWEWKNGRREVDLDVICLASAADAARHVVRTLRGIELPSYSSISGVGDEAYWDQNSGWVTVRTKTVVINVRGHRVKATVMKRFAERLATAIGN